ncbi:MAG: methylmalonyl-CoA mutase family protein, partial [Armatimonadota bacterium]|nr:methylmalonyl-CoA mutase family protein [Armatimonadota bacterium]
MAAMREREGVEPARRRWEETTLRETLERQPERPWRFTTLSDLPVERLYGPEDVAQVDFHRDIGYPGEYPFTRGIHATMYRGRLWTMRQFAGFGTAEDTNRRFHYLLQQGQTGLSVAFDMPTLMGYDSDHPRAVGEVGREGVAVDTLADMELLFQGIPLDEVSTSMTINAPAAVLYAMYVALADQRGIPRSRLRGTIQNDCLKEFIAQKEWIVPPRPSMKLVVDTFEFCVRETPQWNPISISGYHIREAGATAVQELAFTLADGIAY